MKVQKCICCVPIDKAIMAMGFWMCLTLLGELEIFNPFRLVANVLALTAFFLMQNNDTSKNRKNFLFAFMIWIITSLSVAIFQFF